MSTIRYIIINFLCSYLKSNGNIFSFWTATENVSVLNLDFSERPTHSPILGSSSVSSNSVGLIFTAEGLRYCRKHVPNNNKSCTQKIKEAIVRQLIDSDKRIILQQKIKQNKSILIIIYPF